MGANKWNSKEMNQNLQTHKIKCCCYTTTKSSWQGIKSKANKPFKCFLSERRVFVIDCVNVMTGPQLKEDRGRTLLIWGVNLQPHEREEDLRDDQRVQTSVPGQPPRLLPDRRPRLLRHGVLTGRRPHDPHPQQRLHRGPDQVCVSSCRSKSKTE